MTWIGYTGHSVHTATEQNAASCSRCGTDCYCDLLCWCCEVDRLADGRRQAWALGLLLGLFVGVLLGILATDILSV